MQRLLRAWACLGKSITVIRKQGVIKAFQTTCKYQTFTKRKLFTSTGALQHNGWRLFKLFLRLLQKNSENYTKSLWHLMGSCIRSHGSWDLWVRQTLRLSSECRLWGMIWAIQNIYVKIPVSQKNIPKFAWDEKRWKQKWDILPSARPLRQS